jgi:hypothetical protein
MDLTYYTRIQQAFDHSSVKVDTLLVYRLIPSTIGNDPAPTERHAVSIDS